MKLSGRIIVILLFCAVTVFPLGAEVLEYRYRKGEKYRILSEVEEDVYINNSHSHSSKLLNRISVETVEARDGSGLIRGSFETSEKSVGRYSTYAVTQDYDSEFWRDRLGFYTIGSRYFMPVVRDVPVFPDRDLKAGDTWSAEGHEVHDFRESFFIPEPYKFPINVTYQYLGKDETGKYDLISIKYAIFHKTPFTGGQYSSSLFPVRVTGFSSQILKWDNAAGRPFSYSEEFDIMLDLSTGDVVEYTGMARAEVIEAEYLDRDRVADEIRESLEDSGFSDVRVEKVEEGVKVIIENIQFLPDSADLADRELEKLERIGLILMKNPDRDILVTGHTAHAGTEEGRKLLSLQRAKAVAEYLLSLGVIREKQARIQGKGSTEPLGDNSTEDGRSRNRRVEITILEN